MPTGFEAALAPLAQEKGFLTLLYQDLAQPGVRQVGKALATVLGVGNTILIPLRMLNEAGRVAEQRSFGEIAERFSTIPQEEIIEVRPELGVPIIEGLSQTSDPSLRKLFIELLASASSSKYVKNAHPSFANIIGNLTPDEALLIRHLKKNPQMALIEITLTREGFDGYRSLVDHQIDFGDDLAFQSNIPLYLSNLSGLGLVEVQRDTWLTEGEEYGVLFSRIKNRLGLKDKLVLGDEEYNVGYDKHVLKLLPLGRTFIEACVD